MNKLKQIKQTINMKKCIGFILIFIVLLLAFYPQSNIVRASASDSPILALVIDDFGGYERDGVDKILSITEPMTCAVIPLCENSDSDMQRAKAAGHEVILHMPMEAHVRLPENWYGNIVIRNGDTDEIVKQKLDKAVETMPEVRGANIHIGSGVSKNKRVMKAIYDYMKNKNMFFLDSRTILNGVCEDVCKTNNITYLGRDVFLEADKNRSYNAVIGNLKEACEIAKEQGYAVAIGHVGKEGGENTADAIINMLPRIKEMGIKIVPLSEVYKKIDNTKQI